MFPIKIHFYDKNEQNQQARSTYSTIYRIERQWSTIATSLVQSKLDYCNSLYLNLPAYHITKLQVIQNNMARAVTSKRKFDRITPTLRSLHWLKIE